MEVLKRDYSKNIFLFLIILIGAALRFYALDFGLPHNYHPDEVPKVNVIMGMLERGDLNPNYFFHPSLLLYLTFALAKLLTFFAYGEEFRQTCFVAGRTVSAIAGVASIYLIYLIGRRLYSRDVGLLAACLLAIFPLHVTCSRYMREDALLVFLVLLTLLTVLVAVKREKLVWYLVSALLVGATTSAKYSGLLSVCILYSAPWLKSRSIRPDSLGLRYVLIPSLVIPIGFILLTPYSILDFSDFAYGVGKEKRHMQRGHTAGIDPWSHYWMYHFLNSIVPGVTTPVACLFVIALGYLLWRRKLEDLYILVLLLLFYLPAEWVRAKPLPQPERYILPCIPFLALALSSFIFSLRANISRSLVVSLLLLFPLAKTLLLASEIKQDTRQRMFAWMQENVPSGSKIYCTGEPYCPKGANQNLTFTYLEGMDAIEMLSPTKLKRSGYDYLILSSFFYGRFFIQYVRGGLQREMVAKVFSRVPILTQVMPQFESYGFHNPTLTLFSLKQEDFAALQSEIDLKRKGDIKQTFNEARASFNWKK